MLNLYKTGQSPYYMRKLAAITPFFFLVFAKPVHSQTLVSTTSNTIRSASYQFEYAVGEIAIITLSDVSIVKTHYITQGLLQPVEKYLGPDCKIINDTLQYFPNPTTSLVSVVARYDWITGYHIYAADGKLVRATSFFNNYIDLTNLPAAVYFIKLFPGCNNKYRILKVVKQ
jgi:hypothetical protein